MEDNRQGKRERERRVWRHEEIMGKEMVCKERVSERRKAAENQRQARRESSH